MSTPSIQRHRLSALICVLTIPIFVAVTGPAAAEPEDPRQKIFVPIGPFAAPELDTSSIKKDREEEPADTSTGKEAASDAENEQNRQGDVPDTSTVPVVTSSPADDGAFGDPPNLTDDSGNQPK